MEAYEAECEFFKKEILAPLQPFHINAFTTTLRSEIRSGVQIATHDGPVLSVGRGGRGGER